jgi:ketosteroid isomerase-like protein
MSNTLAETFMQTLQQIEGSRDPAPLVALFSDDAELLNLALTEPSRGQTGAQEFWKNYLGAFREVRSTFHRHVATDTDATLEWTSDGRLPDGEPIAYRGVSILEMQDGKVKRFRTYYDSAAFLPGGAKHKQQ